MCLKTILVIKELNYIFFIYTNRYPVSWIYSLTERDPQLCKVMAEQFLDSDGDGYVSSSDLRPLVYGLLPQLPTKLN